MDAVVNLIGEEINQRLTDEAKGRIRESRITGREPAAGDRRARGEAEGLRRPVRDRLLRRPRRRDLDEEARPARASGPRSRSSGRLPSRRPESSACASCPAHGPDPRQGLRPVEGAPATLQARVGGPLAGGDQYMSWIHLDDEVGMILWALDNDQVSGVINATAPNPVTNKEFSKALGGALGRPSFFPAPKLAVAALRGRELAEMVTGSARVIPAPRAGPRLRLPLPGYKARARGPRRGDQPGRGSRPGHLVSDIVVCTTTFRRSPAMKLEGIHHSPRSRPRREERRLLRRAAGPAHGQEDGQPGRPDRLPPLLRRRAGEPGLGHHLLRVSPAPRGAVPATAWCTDRLAGRLCRGARFLGRAPGRRRALLRAATATR